MNYSKKIIRVLNQPQVTLAILFILFFIPPVLAVWSYMHHGLWQRGASNHGLLLAKPPNLSLLGINENQYHGRWNLWAIEPKSCDTSCKQGLYTITQVRSALGKERSRITRLATAVNPDTQQRLQTTVNSEFDGTVTVAADEQKIQTLFQNQRELSRITAEGGLFIVDPIGNVVLAYRYDEKPSPIFSDLRHLLNISRIG